MPRICRHFSALRRNQLSRPIKQAIAKKIILPSDTIFDYGCGFGGDVERLRILGYKANGFDPYYARHNPLIYSDIVTNLFVIDVIENESDRIAVIKKCWMLCRKIFLLAVRMDGEIRSQTTGRFYNDGRIRLRTFQRGWHQPDFREFVEDTLQQKTYLFGDGMVALVKNLDYIQHYRDHRNIRLTRIVRPELAKRHRIGNSDRLDIPVQAAQTEPLLTGHQIPSVQSTGLLSDRLYGQSSEISSYEPQCQQCADSLPKRMAWKHRKSTIPSLQDNPK
ncbi:hypothetical protein [Synechococcus sp. PCC 7502]|uniref:hypothetical protein n=1 Tax=Synechococcus sp. PCC 7502 TaxID=1173263 RepID=UPI000310D93B|nr:hypothetical protein [Synechococcus sp. PCC 7502]